MAISQTTVTGSFKTPANTDARVLAVIFRLSGSDFENGEGITANSVPAATVAEDGDFTITVWPNDKGVFGNTRYSVQYVFDDGSVFTALSDVIVRYSPEPWTLEEIAFQMEVSRQIAPTQFRLVTAAQFEALNPPAPNTTYLIRV